MLLFASDFCVFDLKVLPTAATLTGTNVVHLTDTAHERYGTSGDGDCDGWTWQDMESPSEALSPLFHFLEKVMGEQESLQLVFTVWEKTYCSRERPEMCL